MIVSSVRLGHANNSSSSHSILLRAKSPARLLCADYQFGWEWFHLKSRRDKARYLAVLLWETMKRDLGNEIAAVVVNELVGVDLRSIPGDRPYDCYVDHNSQIDLPKLQRDYGDNKAAFDLDFAKELVLYVRDNPIVSCRGGNDNGTISDEDMDLLSDGDSSPVDELTKHDGSSKLVSRKDGDWWTLYNVNTGAKIRLSFKDDPAPYVKASKPELVDVKITDRCARGCPFCYQASGKDGEHAGKDSLRDLFFDMSNAGVFEVAFGGGEPTLHPDFAELLKEVFEVGPTPNFSTYDMSWTKDEAIVKAVKSYCGSFAVSSLDAVAELAKWNRVHGSDTHGHEDHESGPTGTLQIPMGCYPRERVEVALNEAHALHVPVTFLGFKGTGRGKKFQCHPYAWIIEALKDRQWSDFGADSLFVETFHDELVEMGVHESLMVRGVGEGAFSMYIDMVARKAGPSSYSANLHDLSERTPFDKFPY